MPRHFRELDKLYTDFHSRGFEILAFPTVEVLGAQSKISDLSTFIQKREVKFPFFEMVETNGPNAHEVFKYLKQHSSLKGKDIPWTYHKFLLDRQGTVMKDYSITTFPESFREEIEKLL
jgi:glutathione peroxidase